MDLHERYIPDAIGKQIQDAAEEDEEWSDEAFSDLDDYQTFWGGHFSEVGRHVYKKEIDNLIENEMERFESLSEEVQGNGVGDPTEVPIARGKHHAASGSKKSAPFGMN